MPTLHKNGATTMSKVKIQFPYKMALNISKSQRFLLTTGHIFIALNGFSFIAGVFPIIGIMFALVFFFIASLQKDVFTSETIKFSFRRLILAVLLILVAFTIAAEQEKNIQDLWLVLIFIQLPLSINDAYHVYNGKKGLTVF